MFRETGKRLLNQTPYKPAGNASDPSVQPATGGPVNMHYRHAFAHGGSTKGILTGKGLSGMIQAV